MQTVKSIYKKVITNPNVMRVVHTFWQSFAAVFLVGIFPLTNSLVQTHNFSDVKVGVVGLVVAAVAAGLSAAKGLVVTWRESNGKKESVS